MKNIKYLFSAFVATFLLAGCSDDPTYTNGEADNPNCYGVYFPTQSKAGSSELDPTDPTTFTFEVSRVKSVGEITVPVQVEASAANVFVVAPITFADGADKASFSVSFPTAEVGKTYTCSIRVTDPAYALTYGTKSTELQFSVRRVKWLDVDANKTITYKGTAYTGYEWYTDDILTTFYGVGNSTYPVKVQVRADSADEAYPNGPKGLAGVYRVIDAYGAIYPFNDPGDYDENVSIVINASDPTKVYIESQYMGIHWTYGKMHIWSMADYYLKNPSKGSPAAYYGKIEGGAITFPAKSLMIAMDSYQNGGYYNSNNNGAFRLVVCQDQVVDYSFSISNKEPKDGTVEIPIKLGADIKKVKYAFFEGSLSATLAAAKSADMNNGMIPTAEATATGTINAQLEKTGIYTIVANLYNASNVMVGMKNLTFGYIKAGETKPVVATVGVEITNQYIPDGYTSENSVRVYAYGSEIKSGYYGVFESAKLTAGTDLAALVKSNGKALTADNLSLINGKGYAAMVGSLMSGTEYTAVLLAFNGYVTEVKTASVTTAGVPHPLQRNYEVGDVTANMVKANLLKTWNYYAGSISTKTGSPVPSGKRAKIGSAIITDNTTDDVADNPETADDESVDYVDIAGLTGVADKIGGNDKMRFQFADGVLYSIKNQIVGTYNNLPVSYWMTTSTYGGYSANYALVGGIVGDGYIAFVPQPEYDKGDSPLKFTGIRFLAFEDNTLKTPKGGITWFYNLMLVDPTVDAANPMPASAESSAVSLSSLQAIAKASATPNNFVELRGDARMGALIKEFVGKKSAVNYAVGVKSVVMPDLGVAKAKTTFQAGDSNMTIDKSQLRGVLTPAIF